MADEKIVTPAPSQVATGTLTKDPIASDPAIEKAAASLKVKEVTAATVAAEASTPKKVESINGLTVSDY